MRLVARGIVGLCVVALSACVHELTYLSETRVEGAPVREDPVLDKATASHKLTVDVGSQEVQIAAAYLGPGIVRQFSMVQQRYWTGDGYWLNNVEKMIGERPVPVMSKPLQNMEVLLSDDHGGNWQVRTDGEGIARIPMRSEIGAHYRAKAVFDDGKTVESEGQRLR